MQAVLKSTADAIDALRPVPDAGDGGRKPGPHAAAASPDAIPGRIVVAAAPPARRPSLIAALAVALIGGAVAGAAAGAFIATELRPAPPAGRATTPAPAVASPAPGEGSAALGERVTALGETVGELVSARIAPLEAAADTTAFRLAALGRRIDHVQDDLRRLGEAGPETLPAAIAVLQLKTRVDGGGPFGAELSLVRQFVAETPETAPAMAVLVVGAERGVPTAVDLREAFARLSPLVLEQASRTDGTVIGWSVAQTQHALAFLGFADAPPENPLRVAVAQAQRALDRGQVVAAAAAFDGVDGVAGAIASGWLASARLRIATDHSVDLLLTRTTKRLVGTK
ncbi:MAG: hypothetical protein IT561_19990 [Alphaproteobacteria bacterium]|nr:hypothetical protein [Alphaproteobacteria bacterium]